MHRFLWMSLMFLLSFAALQSAAAKETLAPSPGPKNDLIKAGKTLATIVLPQKPDALEVFAAEELQKYVKAITGSMLPIVHEPQQPSGYRIWLGQTSEVSSTKFKLSEEKLGYDGYAAVADAKGLMIVGRIPLGTLFGVYDLVEREFGVRWFVPDNKHELLSGYRKITWVEPEKIGEVIPQAKDLSIGTFRREFKPSFDIRWVRDGDWSLHNRMNTQVSVKEKPVGIHWKWHFHTFEELLPPQKYFGEHPEWFALVKGKRQGISAGLWHSSQLCTSNPEVIAKLAEGMIQTIEDEPTINVIALGPNDGSKETGFCECEKCRALDKGSPMEGDPTSRNSLLRFPGKLSNRMAVLNNEVARRVGQRFPDVLVKIGAYSEYALPPQISGFRYEPNVLVQICHNQDQYLPIRSDTISKHRNAKMIERWIELVGANQVCVYEYYALAAWGPGAPTPNAVLRPQVYLMRHDIPWYRDRGIKGFYTQNIQQPWYYGPLNHYIAAKLAWNADLDVDWLVKDFCEKFFEAAAAPMHDYLTDLEAVFSHSPPVDSEVLATNYSKLAAKFYSPETRAKLRSHLNRASELANSEVVRKRIELVRRGFNECDRAALQTEKQ